MVVYRFHGVARSLLILWPVLAVAACGRPPTPAPTLMPTPLIASSPTPVVATLPANTPTMPAPSTANRNAPSRVPWWTLPSQNSVHTAEGEFAIKLVDVVGAYLHFYYAMRVVQPGPPQIVITSTSGPCPPQPTQAAVPSAMLHDFGRLDDIEIGVVSFPWVNQPGQAFTLAITPPGAAAPRWYLTPVQQVTPFPNTGYATAGGDATAFPEILISAEPHYDVGGLRFTAVIAKEQSGTVGHYMPQIFLVIDGQGMVTQVTEAQFAAAGGRTGGNSGTVAAIIIPSSYPPTPTIPGIPGYTPAPPIVICA